MVVRSEMLKTLFIGIDPGNSGLLDSAAARHRSLSIKCMPGDAPMTNPSIASADVVVLHRVRWSREQLRAATQCRAIIHLGAGAGCDLEEARELGIFVSSLPGVPAEKVAESLCPILQEYLVSGQPAYRASGHRDFRRPRLGLVGLGRLGRAFAGAARERKFDLRAHDPFALDEDFIQSGAHPVPVLADALGIPDLVSVQVAPAEANRRMISRNEIAVMRKGAWLINAGWGPAVDADAARAAVASGRLARYFPGSPEGDDSLSEQREASEKNLSEDAAEAALELAGRVARGEDPTPLLIDPPCPRWEP